MKSSHLDFKLFSCDIYIVDLDVKVLACAERVVFLLDILIRDGDRKVFDGFFLDKGLDDLLLFLRREYSLLVLAFLDLGSEV